MKTNKKNSSDIELTTENFNSITNLIRNNLKDWQIVGLDLNDLPNIINEKVKITSQNQKKKIKKAIFDLEIKVTISHINRLLKVSGINAKVELSEREKSIKRLRASYVEYRNYTEKFLNEYKLEKGDYYKNRI